MNSSDPIKIDVPGLAQGAVLPPQIALALQRAEYDEKARKQQKRMNAIKIVVAYVMGIISNVVAQWVISKLGL